jgi:DNA-binding SARP family transcriptional activator
MDFSAAEPPNAPVRGKSHTVRPGDLASAVFERYPYGVLVIEEQGRVLAHNVAARELLGESAGRLGDDEPHLACEILGCQKPGTPLEGLCLFDRVRTSEGPLPEFRVDLPAGCGAEAAWVTAAPLTDDRRLSVVELRPGRADDRRRRSDPHWTRGPRLRVVTLGRTRVESPEGELAGTWLEHRAGQVLKLLVAERPRALFADEIADTLWPDASLRSLQGVRYYIHALRGYLEPDRPSRQTSAFVVHARGGYTLDLRRIEVDADEFEREVQAGLDAMAAGDAPTAQTRLRAALELYGGDFLADEPYAEWAVAERDRLRQLAGRALRTLADADDATDDLEAAAASLERLVAMEPYDLDVHRRLLALCLRRGRRTDAVRRYTALRRRMMTVFGEDLDFTLADLQADTAA